jgi:hypothetical protein
VIYEQEQLQKFKKIDPDAMLAAAKADKSNEYPYITAFVGLAWEWKSLIRAFEHAVQKAERLENLEWAAEMVLANTRVDAPSDKEDVWEGLLYPAAKVIEDLRARGWTNDQLRRHKITDLEIQEERYVVPSDLCAECEDPDTFVGPDKTFCSLCEDEFVEVARYEHEPTTP